MIKGFTNFDKKECMRTNIKVGIFFLIIILSTIILDVILIKASIGYVKNSHNGFVDLAMIVMFIFLTMAVLIIYSVIVTLKIKIYRELFQNMKSLITLSIINILIALFIAVTIGDFIGWMYLGAVLIMCSASFSIRYSLVCLKEKKDLY